MGRFSTRQELERTTGKGTDNALSAHEPAACVTLSSSHTLVRFRTIRKTLGKAGFSLKQKTR